MSLLITASGKRFLIEPPTGIHEGLLNQRMRKLYTITFIDGEASFPAIKDEMKEPQNTNVLKLYPNENNPDVTDEALEPPVTSDGKQAPGPTCEVLEGFTVLGEIKEESIIIKEGTIDTPPEYGRQLSITLGQRQYGE